MSFRAVLAEHCNPLPISYSSKVLGFNMKTAISMKVIIIICFSLDDLFLMTLKRDFLYLGSIH